MAGGEDFITPAELAGNAYVTAVRSKASALKTELINQTLDDIESWSKAVEVQWANHHPDHPDGPLGPIPEQDIDQYRDQVRNEYYDWVEPAFERRLRPDPDAANAMIDSLVAIEGAFQGSTDDAGRFTPTSPALSRIADALIDMDHWQGRLQEGFVDALTKLDQDAYDHGERELEKGLRDLYTTISELRSRSIAANTSGPLSVARPALDNASARDILAGAFRPDR